MEKNTPVGHIVGGGVMGLLAGLELEQLSRRLGLDIRLRLYEAQTFGGGLEERTSAPRSQAWLHTDGQLYAQTQPTVCLSLQESTRRLRRLAPEAFRYPPAFAVEILASAQAEAPAAYRSLGVPHWRCSADDLRRWFPSLRLPSGTELYRVRDATIDLAILSALRVQRLRRADVSLTLQGVQRLGLKGGRVRYLICDNGERALLGEEDFVILACGASIRPLLAGAGVTIEGLRVFRSHLICSDAPRIPALVAVLKGGLTCVPHCDDEGRLLNIFGNSARNELPPEEDGKPVRANPRAIEELRHESEDWFQTPIPADALLGWAGVKTEIVGSGVRSQSSHAFRINGLENCWAAVPGKLSQTPACGLELSRHILRQRLGAGRARSIWEGNPEIPSRVTAAAG